jgi:hypothetical protein
MHATQVDGPCHFTNDSRKTLGPTRLKRELMALNGWSVIAVPWFHWERLRRAYERELYMYQILQAS